MMALESLLAFMAASILLGLVPGPDNIFVLTQSALYGRKSGLLVTLGLCSGLIVHTLAVALGLAAIFQTSEMAFTLLKLLGAAYLLYLAWQAFTASRVSLESDQTGTLTGLKLYQRGIIMNLTNPKVSIFFLAFLPQFTLPENGPLLQQVLLLGGVFILCTLIVFSMIAVLAGQLGHWLKQSPKATQVMNRMAGTVFIALAVKLSLTSNQL